MPLRNFALIIICVAFFLTCGSVCAGEKPGAPAKVSDSIGIKTDSDAKELFANLDYKDAAEPAEKEPPVYMTVLSFTTKLAIVLLLAYGTILALKKFGGARSMIGAQGRIHVIEHSSIGASKSLHIIQVGSKKMLIASTATSVSLLTELDPDDVPDVAIAEPASFKDQLAGFIGSKPESGNPAGNVSQMLRDASLSLQDRVRDLGTLRKNVRTDD